MKNESYLRYLLNDNRSLNKYYCLGEKVSLDELKRFILLKVREKQYSVPDHYYRLGNEFSFDGILNLSEVFTVGLPRLADEYLGVWDSRVFVLGKKFNEWQLLLPDLPPLILIISKIWRFFGPVTGPIVDYAHDYLLPSVKYTAFPSPYLPEMKVMEDSIKGFSDLHIHLNGAVETDLAWHDFLRFPEKVYKEIKDAYRNPKVKEQIEQLTDISSPKGFLSLFLIAGRLRKWLFDRVMENGGASSAMSFHHLLEGFAIDKREYKEHPFKSIMGESASPLILEGMLYVKILDFLDANREDDVTAGIFHYYLLITGLTNRLLVQQNDAFGFEQFQKYTSNNLREYSERTYDQRFLQLAGNDLNGFRHIEGRFSPKDTLVKNKDLVEKILNGVDKLTLAQTASGLTPSSLSLVAHFIKKPDTWKGDIRFRKLRNELKDKTAALIALKNTGCRESGVFIGIDAAASEFDTPPEVFAPYFRRLRAAGFKHFTYHAGEDFYHILTGLRAIYEAMMYFDMRPTDRIGHATATGVDVALWKSNIGERIWMRKEDYLDDLIFAYCLITDSKDKDLRDSLPLISLRCQELASQIYEKSCGMDELIGEWKMRWMDPLDDIDWGNSLLEELFRYRHSKEGRNKGKEIISVDTYDIFGEDELIRLQQLLLKEMHDRQIIIETLPTSNIIIGHHHDFKSYHIYNWYKWGKEGHEIPAIVVGCDDAGIFATNIFNEYCHIYCLLVFDKGLTPQAAMDFIHHLAQNTKAFQFK